MTSQVPPIFDRTTHTVTGTFSSGHRSYYVDTPVVKVDRRIRWHYTTTILRLRIGARLTRYRNYCKFHNGCRTISRHADGISRYSVPPSAGPLLPLGYSLASTPPGMPGTHPQYFWLGGRQREYPPILLRTFGYSRPILVALRSLSLKPISFGYKTPPPVPRPPHSVVRPSNLELALTPLWIRYDTRCYFNVRSKADMSPLNLPQETNN